MDLLKRGRWKWACLRRAFKVQTGPSESCAPSSWRLHEALPSSAHTPLPDTWHRGARLPQVIQGFYCQSEVWLGRVCHLCMAQAFLSVVEVPDAVGVSWCYLKHAARRETGGYAVMSRVGFKGLAHVRPYTGTCVHEHRHVTLAFPFLNELFIYSNFSFIKRLQR